MIGPKRRLESFDAPAPRRLNTLGAGYTWFVRIARIALPLVAIVIIGIVVARLSLDRAQENITDLPDDKKTSAGQIELIEAKYEGVDAKGRRYTLTADSANRSNAEPDTVVLSKPKADIALQGGNWLALEAGGGTYNTETAQMILSDGVRIFHDSGNEMHLQDVTVDTKTSRATSSHAVTAQGPLGTLSAQNVTISDEGDLIVFGGPATMTLYKLSPKKGSKG